jgi:hypothetical protein
MGLQKNLICFSNSLTPKACFSPAQKEAQITVDKCLAPTGYCKNDRLCNKLCISYSGYDCKLVTVQTYLCVAYSGHVTVSHCSLLKAVRPEQPSGYRRVFFSGVSGCDGLLFHGSREFRSPSVLSAPPPPLRALVPRGAFMRCETMLCTDPVFLSWDQNFRKLPVPPHPPPATIKLVMKSFPSSEGAVFSQKTM